MRWLADLIYVFAGLAYLPVALYQAIVLGKNRRGWGERFGSVPLRDAGKPRIWIHAVSLGEINATPRLVDALRARLPDHDIVVSTTTDTGFARAVQLYGADHVFRFPLDFSLVISRVLRRIRPTLIVLVELEVWYNLTCMATARGVPIAVVNGRLTERSARRLLLLGPFCRQMFPQERELVKTLRDKPFVLLGVNSDSRKRLKKAQKEKNLVWRSFWDGGTSNGPIAQAYHVTEWPTIYVIDHTGKIRHIGEGIRGGRVQWLEPVLKKLIAEAERDSQTAAK